MLPGPTMSSNSDPTASGDGRRSVGVPRHDAAASFEGSGATGAGCAAPSVLRPWTGEKVSAPSRFTRTRICRSRTSMALGCRLAVRSDIGPRSRWHRARGARARRPDRGCRGRSPGGPASRHAARSQCSAASRSSPGPMRAASASATRSGRRPKLRVRPTGAGRAGRTPQHEDDQPKLHIERYPQHTSEGASLRRVSPGQRGSEGQLHSRDVCDPVLAHGRGLGNQRMRP